MMAKGKRTGKKQIRLILADLTCDQANIDPFIDQVNNYLTIVLDLPDDVDTNGYRLVGVEWLDGHKGKLGS